MESNEQIGKIVATAIIITCFARITHFYDRENHGANQDIVKTYSRVADRPHGPSDVLGHGGEQYSAESHFLEADFVGICWEEDYQHLLAGPASGLATILDSVDSAPAPCRL